MEIEFYFHFSLFLLTFSTTTVVCQVSIMCESGGLQSVWSLCKVSCWLLSSLCLWSLWRQQAKRGSWKEV